MEHLRLFENYKSDEEIHKICKKYKIKNYTINKDGSIDVDGNVNLNSKGLIELPLVFNEVSGDFLCGSNISLKSLKGSPRVIKGEYYIQNSHGLTNLIGGPDEVGGQYRCRNNKQLTSLEGMARTINYMLDISNNPKLIDFRGLPDDLYVKDYIIFDNTPVYDNLKEFLKKYSINIKDIESKYSDLMIEINGLDAIQNGEIIDIRMDEVLYNIGLI